MASTLPFERDASGVLAHFDCQADPADRPQATQGRQLDLKRIGLGVALHTSTLGDGPRARHGQYVANADHSALTAQSPAPCFWIALTTCSFTASMLNDAPFCMGGNATKDCPSLVTSS